MPKNIRNRRKFTPQRALEMLLHHSTQPTSPAEKKLPNQLIAYTCTQYRRTLSAQTHIEPFSVWDGNGVSLEATKYMQPDQSEAH
jgi:hypothetical protein